MKDETSLDVNEKKPMNYVYTYSYHEDEFSLCCLEMRSFFGVDTSSTVLESTVEVDPSRSPFIKERVDVMFRGDSIEALAQQLKTLTISNATFKVTCIKDHIKEQKIGFKERRAIERELGLLINGEVDLHYPDLLFGIMKLSDQDWIFGKYVKAEAVWLKHQQKPHQYSTALSTRVARAVANIAAPSHRGLKVIDPCCGIGTVVIEALSMGMDVVGSDVNPLVTPLARENLAYFGLSGEIGLRDIRQVTGQYDVAIIDMPYNLCSKLDLNVQLEMLECARGFAKKMVVVTIESIDHLIEKAGFRVVDRCVAQKGRFTRQVIVCE